MQTELNNTIQRYDELTKHFHTHSLKVDQIIRKSKDSEIVLQSYEQKLSEET